METLNVGLAERVAPGQTLLFDADDTLWENNIYFERSIADFISLLNHRELTREEVRAQLNQCEHATISKSGYGLKSFRRSLVDCFELLSDVPVTPELDERIGSFAQAIADQEIELLPDVAATLNELAARHTLVMVTKGDIEEQTDKLERSGLRPLFARVEVLAEKHGAAYQQLRERHGWEAARTWMIGNSPKSDVNPALEAGLNAVFVPHDHTWVLEHEVVNAPADGQSLLTLEGFAELLRWF